MAEAGNKHGGPADFDSREYVWPFLDHIQDLMLNMFYFGPIFESKNGFP